MIYGEYRSDPAFAGHLLSLERRRQVLFVYLSRAVCHFACTVYLVILHVSYSFASHIKETKSVEENTRQEKILKDSPSVKWRRHVEGEICTTVNKLPHATFTN